ncbi:thioesterase family protein [Auritidibacter sp. NML100628]|uniref:acyl-CoA thioesterase n=1 Tax=Auritidibacter sp. NML100628 TaxID=2170742 RepID=UPI000D73C9DE|nr:thioesterase family protein [Auritidibacter sp. NML100628]PXA76838.1 thioesterase [Auritidibacter sp. NML100628]
MPAESRAPSNAFHTRLQLRWADQDLNHHVNNATLLTLIEEARVLANQSWTGDSSDGNVAGTYRLVRATTIDYVAPVHYLPEDPDYRHAVDARVWVTKVGNTSFTLGHELSQPHPCVYAEAVLVVLSAETNRPTPIPEPLRDLLVAQTS